MEEYFFAFQAVVGFLLAGPYLSFIDGGKFGHGPGKDWFNENKKLNWCIIGVSLLVSFPIGWPVAFIVGFATMTDTL